MELPEEVSELAECVWVAVGKVDFVLFLAEGKLKGQVEVVTNETGVHVGPAHNFTLSILDFIASLVPFKALALLG